MKTTKEEYIPKYTILITTADRNTHLIKSDNIIDGLLKFEPNQVKGKIVLNIKNGNKTVEKVIFVPQARKIFFNRSSLMIYARNLERAIM